jgi:hypothetical protein
MPRTIPLPFTCTLLLAAAALTPTGAAQTTTPTMAAPARPAAMAPHAILPTGMGDAVDRDVARLRAATERFKSSTVAIAEGYPQETGCVQHQPHGAMGYHFGNPALKDATLDLEKPEVLVYEKRPDGTFQLNGVEFYVPFSAWTKAEPPTIMGQSLKRADSLGFWYLHVWNWTANPSGLFADWNPDVKC